MPRRLASRLLIAQVLVLLASIVTAGVVALAVGPTLFHQHLLDAGEQANTPELDHIEAGYRDASAVSLGVALVIALACAVAVTWYVTRRLQAPLRELADAASEVSRGHLGARVGVRGTAAELDTVADAFNLMADQLEQTEQTRRRLLSDVAHEMRTPISTIKLYCEGLSDGVTTWDDETARIVTEQTDRLVQLTRDIEEVSRAEEGRLALELGHVALAEIAAASVRAASDAYAKAGVQLVLEGPAGSDAAAATATVDRRRIGQVVDNLLSNALRHTSPGGVVTVSVRRAGPEVELEVRDSGEGMTREQLSHVFERFYRGESARERDRRGSGIGLTISRAIVDAHGGAIVARSAGPGRGSSLLVSLPADSAVRTGRAPSPGNPARSPGGA